MGAFERTMDDWLWNDFSIFLGVFLVFFDTADLIGDFESY